MEKVIRTLEVVRPFSQRDGGDIELVGISKDIEVYVHRQGACGTCSSSINTLKAGVEQY